MPTDPQSLLTLGITSVLNIIVVIFFCRTLSSTLSLVKPENRVLSITVIWLLLIPVLKVIINFFVVSGMSKSLNNELESRDFEIDEKPALISGIVFAITSLVEICVSMVLAVLTLRGYKIPEHFLLPISFLGVVQFFFFVQYWMKINWFKNILEKDEDDEVEDGN